MKVKKDVGKRVEKVIVQFSCRVHPCSTVHSGSSTEHIISKEKGARVRDMERREIKEGKS